MTVYAVSWRRFSRIVRSATTSQAQPTELRPEIGSRTGVWHSPVEAVLVQVSVGSGRSGPHVSPAGKVSRTVAEAGSAVMRPLSIPAAKRSLETVVVPPFGTGLTVRTDGQVYRLQLNTPLISDDSEYGLSIVAPANKWTPLYIPLKLLEPPATADDVIPMSVACTQFESLIITPLGKPQAFQLMVDDVALVR